jgi:rod shape-determining protein MreB
MLSFFKQHELYWRFSDTTSHLLDATSGRESKIKPAVGLVERGGVQRVAWIGEDLGSPSETRVVHPFSHPRLVLHEFEVAQALLAYQLQLVHGRRVMRRPSLVVHPLRTLASPLTDMEQRALLELGHSVGAHRVAVHTGPELGRPEVSQKQLAFVPAPPRRRGSWL